MALFCCAAWDMRDEQYSFFFISLPRYKVLCIMYLYYKLDLVVLRKLVSAVGALVKYCLTFISTPQLHEIEL